MEATLGRILSYLCPSIRAASALLLLHGPSTDRRGPDLSGVRRRVLHPTESGQGYRAEHGNLLLTSLQTQRPVGHPESTAAIGRPLSTFSGIRSEDGSRSPASGLEGEGSGAHPGDGEGTRPASDESRRGAPSRRRQGEQRPEKSHRPDPVAPCATPCLDAACRVPAHAEAEAKRRRYLNKAVLPGSYDDKGAGQ
jgi:hypothetical protein